MSVYLFLGKKILPALKFSCDKLKIPPYSFTFYYSKRVNILLPPRLFMPIRLLER